MKKLIIFILVLIIAIFPLQTVFASVPINFECESVECKKNRLIDINIYAECDKKLSAALFEFTFDRNIFEFRDADAISNDALVKYYDTGNSVRIHYLNTWGENISEKIAIFTVTLKSIDYGTCALDFTAYDCVDSDVESIAIGSCTSSTLSVLANAPDNSGKKDNSKNSNGDNKNDKTIYNFDDVSNPTEEETKKAEHRDLGLINPYDDTPIYFLLAGAAIAFSLVGFGYLFYMIIKKFKSNKNKNEINENE